MPFFQRSTGGIAYLIVGLGNPDRKYQNTRHNAGFIAVDEIARQLDVSIDRSKFDALTADVTIGGKRALLMKPQTYMPPPSIRSRRKTFLSSLTTFLWSRESSGSAARAPTEATTASAASSTISSQTISPG